jgi:hypothetical protein
MKIRRILILAVFLCLSITALSMLVSASFNPLGSGIYFAKRVLYALWSYEEARDGINFILDNFRELVLLNPDPQGDEIRPYLGMFMTLMQPIYALAIITTSFYLIFISGTPKGRAKAKTFFSSLLIGMIIVSMSPALLKFSLDTSASATRMVMDRADVDGALNNLQETFGREANVFTTDPRTFSLGQHQTSLFIVHFFLTFIEIELGYYTFLPALLVVWGILVFFSIRFLALTLFIILFPLSVFFYSFHSTRDVGRNMLEEFITWTLIQVFNGFVVAAIALSLGQMDQSFMQIQANVPGFTGGGLINMTFGFIPFTGCFVMLIAPLFIMRLFRNFLP